jgi:hypothetical protein
VAPGVPLLVRFESAATMAAPPAALWLDGLMELFKVNTARVCLAFLYFNLLLTYI